MRRKIVLLTASVLFLLVSTAMAGWAPEGSCFNCHPKIWNQWASSGHPYKLRTADEARVAGIPLPEGYSWADISLVIGGRYKKARYIDQDGYIITMTGKDRKTPGKNQYNIESGGWSDYNAGKETPYKCGPCHMTGYLPEGHQDSMEGAFGTWKYGGVACEECHGMGEDHVLSGGDSGKITVDKAAALCGKCHIRGEMAKIPASGGFIRHHEQFNEQQSSKMSKLGCVACHDPHLSARIGVIKACAGCHADQDKDFTGSPMQQVGIVCKDCHMPKLVVSALSFAKYEGDIRTHLFTINIDPQAKQFSDDGSFANPYVTVEFACLNCHRNKDRDWALKYAKGVHKAGK